jgi:hypothetical protein
MLAGIRRRDRQIAEQPVPKTGIRIDFHKPIFLRVGTSAENRL